MEIGEKELDEQKQKYDVQSSPQIGLSQLNEDWRIVSG